MRNLLFSITPKQEKGAFLGKASICLLLVTSLYYSAPSYSFEALPPFVSRDFAKGLIQGGLMAQLKNSTTGIRDEALRTQLLSCILPALNEAVDKSFPAGVNSLDAATFEQRLNLVYIEKSYTGSEFERCLARLKPRIEQSRQARATNQFPSMDLDDLRTDLASLQGRKVRVNGTGHYVMNMFMLIKGPTDTSPLFIDITKLNRDQRRRVLQQCNDLMTGCRVAVYGTVEKVTFQMGISAENIEFQ